jgi:hypothetical protein
MWMGGRVPVGYNVKDQKLIIDTTEAEQVKGIFRLVSKTWLCRQIEGPTRPKWR